jgi:hypothetical protein
VFFTNKHPQEEGQVSFSNENVFWQSSKKQTKELIELKDIVSSEWIYTSKGYQVRIFKKDQSFLFSGFKKDV